MLLNIYEHSYSIIILKIRYRYSCYILFACLLQLLPSGQKTSNLLVFLFNCKLINKQIIYFFVFI